MSNLKSMASHIAKEVASGLIITDSQNDLNKYFGGIDDVHNHLVTIKIPYPLRLSWDLGTTVTKIRVHEQVAESVIRIFTKVLNHYGIEKIKELGLDIFGGSYNKRQMTGSDKWSSHAWGISLDFDPLRNKLRWGKDKAQFAKPEYDFWWKCWEDEGWHSLGRDKNFDFMHIQFAKRM